MTLADRIILTRSALAGGSLRRLNTSVLHQWTDDPGFAAAPAADRAWVLGLLEERARRQSAFHRTGPPADCRPPAPALPPVPPALHDDEDDVRNTHP